MTGFLSSAFFGWKGIVGERTVGDIAPAPRAHAGASVLFLRLLDL